MWKIYCITEGGWTYGDQESAVCYHDAGHTVNPDSVAQNSQLQATVAVTEEDIPTGGNYATETKRMVSTVQGENVHDFTWKFPINVLSLAFTTGESHRGDSLSMCAGPETPVTTLTSISDKVLTVADTTYLKCGYYLTIGTDTEIAIVGVSGNDVTLDTAPVGSYSAGEVIKVTKYVVPIFHLEEPWRYTLGEDKIGSSYVNTGTIVRVKYNNSTTSTKILVAEIHRLY